MVYSTSSFKTRARTIDHLGREQIADCPTAISELWKNAYDAYARNVELHLFDGETNVAAILDDGHGMSRQEFETKWLTVGTESKTNGFEIPLEDRNGLDQRPKQGQKGIGRLSSAALGPLLLLVSKRRKQQFVAALIDWRLFENPFLYLHDIRIPVTEFLTSVELIEHLPGLFDQMMGNIWGDSDDLARNQRLSDAWKEFSAQEEADGKEFTTQKEIEKTLIKEVFSEEHFNKWSVYKGESEHGTAMFIADIIYDLEVQLSKTPLGEADESEKATRDRFHHTLSNFTDPFSKGNEPSVKGFNCLVRGWKGIIPFDLVSEDREFDIKNLEDLEHVIEGHVDQEGYFNGRVKAFGVWSDKFTVKPKYPYKTRKDTAFGAFDIRVGTFELNIGSTSLSEPQHAFFSQQAERYGGFRVYRDGLRVMPYGRVDSDYFSIEYRRSKNAGRYFWANRRMFGRVAISRQANPNLKDKAGREGIIENRASKYFREIVENVLLHSADRFFGRKSDIRAPALADIKEQKTLEKAENDRKKLQSKERSRIRNSIKKNLQHLISHVDRLSELKNTFNSRLSLNSIDELQKLKVEIDTFNEATQGFSLSPIPSNLGRLEDDYKGYRKYELTAKELVKELTFVVNKALSESTQKSDYEKASEVYRSKLASINSSITRFSAQGKEMLAKQIQQLDELTKYCREQYKSIVEGDLEDLKLEKLSLSVVLDKLDEVQAKVEVENTQKLSPYITALERINEQIDLEGLAVYSMNESLKYRDEVARLHSLAQLGITVEIIGHELEGLDQIIAHSLKNLHLDGLTSTQDNLLEAAIHSHESLMDKLRFLSPLKLSGKKVIEKVTGLKVEDYIRSYFGEHFEKANINFEVTDDFKSMVLQEVPSRIYPVFINIINNSLYWCQRSEIENRKILLDIKDDEVYISDSGRGVDEDDYNNLFTLFFTRKQKGGRGVGLYLCKQNLMAGGHNIRYETRSEKKLLAGANFVIEFKGLTND
ncbi:histidine kinase [Vibrio sp. S17_S38]|uniref:sensor histidine kinase n=1 Tax=Vibrio sp. S17_S38 TaxID=2720229 RepID=UPI00167FFAA1|nr:sensor histidine kinase [Vibrio sp. S17_S38]MBD1573044.1 histidine kinase [Vibrio sp. S17_S38]